MIEHKSILSLNDYVRDRSARHERQRIKTNRSLIAVLLISYRRIVSKRKPVPCESLCGESFVIPDCRSDRNLSRMHTHLLSPPPTGRKIQVHRSPFVCSSRSRIQEDNLFVRTTDHQNDHPRTAEPLTRHLLPKASALRPSTPHSQSQTSLLSCGGCKSRPLRSEVEGMR